MIIKIIGTSLGQTYTEMDSLLGHLFNASRYNKFVRPLHNQTHVIKVNFKHIIKSIEEFDIASGELLITSCFEIKWIDEMLLWNPTLYRGKSKIPLPKGMYWKPEFYLTNGPANEDSSIYGSGFAPAWTTYKGLVKVIPAGSYKTKCNIDTTSYPYDIHTCMFRFVVSNHDSSDLILNSPKPAVYLSGLKEHGEWEIINFDAQILHVKENHIEDVTFPMFQTSLYLKRRPTFEIITAFAPLTLMSCLNMATCFIRPDSGERLSFAITLYLSLVLTATAVTETIPKNSLKMPYFSYQVLTINCINTVGVLWSIFIVHFSNNSRMQHRLPEFLVKMVMKRRQKNLNFEIVREKSRLSMTSFEHAEKNEKDIKAENAEECSYMNGQEVAEALDEII
ncbi:neuronal acetylcholine receptor subunit beta-3-like [Ruditapes philippinarum]|uniref:neuronal acetylcholine receptor subunit beta-3-like n=1 Tax=Ruditapes philippinarum TaxID=129788 RepID=UPI00295BF07A|nr:neuronal acetylcholine receptor subunit beta-3-like [Ruditapes philippinarum]